MLKKFNFLPEFCLPAICAQLAVLKGAVMNDSNHSQIIYSQVGCMQGRSCGSPLHLKYNIIPMNPLDEDYYNGGGN